MAKVEFFSEQREQSKIKTTILTKYFDDCTKIIGPRFRNGRIAYIDLFSGPGKFEDDSLSTPLLILEKCINDVNLGHRVVQFLMMVIQNLVSN